MAKKRVRSKRSAKKPPKRPAWSVQLLKMVTGLAVLVLLVTAAAFLADRWLDSSSEQDRAARQTDRHQRAPQTQPSSPPAAPPVYEVFPRPVPPATEPPRSRPPLPGGRAPLVAIIIDDIGYDQGIAERFMALDVPLTLSVLPHGPFSRTISSQARLQGAEIMLHLPMEPNEYPDVNPGPGALLSSMSPDELIAQLEKDIDVVNDIKGVNNHMGSRMSTSPEQMRQIFSILKKRGLYYVDSRTTAETVAQGSARLLQLPFIERDIFIDHHDDPAFVRSQIQRLVERARRQGYAVGIAHPHETTYRVLVEMLPKLKRQVSLVPASMVVQRVMTAQEDAGFAQHRP